MTLVGWVAYTLATSLLVAVAAWLVDAGITRLGLATRWVWSGALLFSLGLATLAPLRPPQLHAPGDAPLVRAASGGTSDGTVDASGQARLETLSLYLNRGLDWLERRVTVEGGVEAWMWGAWTVASLLVALVTLGSTTRLVRRARSWPVEVLLGRRVRVTDFGPATIGLFAPDVIIPEWARELPAHELELVLRHEEEHAAARDPLLLAVALLFPIAAPWNPVAWWLHRRLRDAVEVDCDRRVLRGGVAPRVYGDLLLRLQSARSRAVPVTPMAGSPSLLERRLSALRRVSTRSAWLRAVVCTAPALVLLVAACGTEPPRPEPDVALAQESRDDLRRLRAALTEATTRGEIRIEELESIPSALQSTELRVVLRDLVQSRSELAVLRDRYNDEYQGIRDVLAKIQAIETEVVPRVLRGIIAELEARS